MNYESELIGRNTLIRELEEKEKKEDCLWEEKDEEEGVQKMVGLHSDFFFGFNVLI